MPVWCQLFRDNSYRNSSSHFLTVRGCRTFYNPVKNKVNSNDSGDSKLKSSIKDDKDEGAQQQASAAINKTGDTNDYDEAKSLAMAMSLAKATNLYDAVKGGRRRTQKCQLYETVSTQTKKHGRTNRDGIIANIKANVNANVKDQGDDSLRFKNGTKIYKLFGPHEHIGKVVNYDHENNLYRILYDDGDCEEFWHNEVKQHLKQRKNKKANDKYQSNYDHDNSGDNGKTVSSSLYISSALSGSKNIE